MGCFSDDTEHAYLTVRAYAQAADLDEFQELLAHGLASWVRCFPGGAGFATLRACTRLAIGTAPERSGINSAGNGPVMRAATLGAMVGNDVLRVRQICAISTHLTHTDPRAEKAAFIVAVAAACVCEGPVDPLEFVNWLLQFAVNENDEELIGIVKHMKLNIETQKSVKEFAIQLGYTAGVTGYAYASTPVALYAWLTETDPAEAIESVIDLGGDTDSTAAVVGALCGVNTSPDEWPAGWVERIVDLPLSVEVLKSTAFCATNGKNLEKSVFGFSYFLRNIGFAIWVTVLVVRRRFFGFIHRRNQTK